VYCVYLLIILKKQLTYGDHQNVNIPVASMEHTRIEMGKHQQATIER
jgi:hypothetical protein